MKNNRIERINSTIKKMLSPLLNDCAGMFFDGTMIGITDVKTTPDLDFCRVYISILSPHEKQEVLNKLIANLSHIRYDLAHKIDLRIMPKLQLEIDNSFDYGNKIETILKNIKYSDEDK